MCLARIPPLYHSFDLPYTFPIMHTSFGPNRSSSLRIEGRLVEESESRRTGGGSSSLAVVVDRAPPTDYPSPSGKGKGKISEIRYPSGSEYLKAVVKYADALVLVGSSPFMKKPSLPTIDPLLAFKCCALIFSPPTSSKFPRWLASLKRPSRTVSVFLCTPLSRTSYNTSTFSRPNTSPKLWGVLVSLLFVFRDKGLLVPNIALLLDFFSVKEVAKGFLYISKRTSARLIISDLPSSHKHWKERYFFIRGRNWEYNPADREDTLGIPTVWTALENLHEFPFVLVGVSF